MRPLSRPLMTSLLIGLVGGVAVAQKNEGGAGHGVDAAPRSAADWIDVTNEADEGRLVFTVGPIDLPANTGHHGIGQPPLLTAEVPVDAYLYGFEVEMVDGQGRPIAQRVLHHVNLIDPDHRELFSPVPLRLFAAGRETQAASMPKILGVPIEKGQRILVSAMFHNPTAVSYLGSKLRVILKYRTEGLIFPLEVYPVYIDVMGHIGKKDFDLPPGRSEKSWEGRPAVGGRLLAAGGHLHDHAVKLVFEDVDQGEVLWETAPVVDERGRTVAVPVGKFWWKGGIKLSADHTYRLTVIYDNPTGDTIIDGGMGVLGGVLKPAEDWPTVDPQDPAYVSNLKRTMETAERRAMGMAGHEGSGGHEHGGHSP